MTSRQRAKPGGRRIPIRLAPARVIDADTSPFWSSGAWLAAESCVVETQDSALALQPVRTAVVERCPRTIYFNTSSRIDEAAEDESS